MIAWGNLAVIYYPQIKQPKYVYFMFTLMRISTAKKDFKSSIHFLLFGDEPGKCLSVIPKVAHFICFNKLIHYWMPIIHLDYYLMPTFMSVILFVYPFKYVVNYNYTEIFLSVNNLKQNGCWGLFGACEFSFELWWIYYRVKSR